MKYTDKELLDKLQEKLGAYTGKVVCRWSSTGRGWRLHESSHPKAVSDVREAIENFIDLENNYTGEE